MTRSLNWRSSAGVTLIVLAVAGVEIWALSTPMVRNLQVDFLGQNLAWAQIVSLDLLIVLPLLLAAVVFAWYQPTWLVARAASLQGYWRRARKAVLWSLGLFTGYAVIRVLPLPDSTFIVVLVLVEAAFLVVVGKRVVKASRAVRLVRKDGHSFVIALMRTVPRVFPSLQLQFALRLIITEFALLTYSMAGWFLPRRSRHLRFSNHRRDDDTVFIAVAFLVLFEAIPVHFLVHHYSTWAAWILTVLSAYTLLWVIGEMSARRYRPTLLTRDWLRVSHGLRGEVVIPLSHIIQVQPIGETEAEASVGTDGQMLFRLSEPTTVFGWFGTEKQATEIRVGIDEPERLLTALADVGIPVEHIETD